MSEQTIDLTKIRALLPSRAVMTFRRHKSNNGPYLEVDVKIVPYLKYEEHDPLIKKIIDLLGEDLLEIKEQIERDARKYEYDVSSCEEVDGRYHGYRNGATAQDKIATNRTVEAVLLLFDGWRTKIDIPDFIPMRKELEKLRRI